MANQLTKAELKKMIQESPKQKRLQKRAARELANAGSYDSKLEIEMQLRRRKSMRGEGKKWEREVVVLPWIHQARSKGKTMGGHFNNRTRNLATVAISYTLRDRSLWIWPHDLAFYVDKWANGYLTDNEMNEMVQWLNAAA